MIPLPSNFALGPNDVLCGRTRDCCNREGNKRLLEIVKEHLPQYLMAASKRDKSDIILAVIKEVEETSCGGGFVRYDPVMKQYYRVNEKIAREKTSQAFRDALKCPFKSGKQTKFKETREKRNVADSSSYTKKFSLFEDRLSQLQHAVSEHSCEIVWNANKVQDVTEVGSRSANETENSPVLNNVDFLQEGCDISQASDKQITSSFTTNIYHQDDNSFHVNFINLIEGHSEKVGFDFSSQDCSYYTSGYISSSRNQPDTNRNLLFSADTTGGIHFFKEISGYCYDDPFEPLPF